MASYSKIYNRIVEALKAEGTHTAELHPLRQAQLKAQLLQQLSQVERGGGMAMKWAADSFGMRLFRYLAPTVVGVSIVGGVVVASGSSLPGQPLYGVKRLKEDVQLSLTFSERTRAETQASLASERIKELEQVHAALTPTVAPVVPTEQIQTNEPVATPPTQVEVTPPLEVEARNNAHDQVQQALSSLRHVQGRFQAAGDTNAASAITNVVNRIKDEAKRNRIKFDDPFDDGQQALPNTTNPPGQTNVNNSVDTNANVNINANIPIDIHDSQSQNTPPPQAHSVRVRGDDNEQGRRQDRNVNNFNSYEGGDSRGD